MKKSKLLFFVPFLVILFFILSCNGTKTETTDTIQKNESSSIPSTQFTFELDCTGYENLIMVNEDTAEAMINHFKNGYHNRTMPDAMNKFNDSVWIDANVINAFTDFLTTHEQEFDGVSFMNIAYPNDSSNIYLVPTRYTGGAHKPDWKQKITVIGNHTFSNFNADTNFVMPAIRKFRSLFRRQSNLVLVSTARHDSLSAEIWFGSCTFKLLSEAIKDTTIKFDGVKVYFSAYNKFDAARRQQTLEQYSNQATVIIAPTTADPQSVHLAKWGAVKATLEKSKNKNGEAFAYPPSGFNHGQICPTQCGNP